eukprot:COSAG02_NODE_6154_length_3763_cov_3.756823_1_plen_308_part_00
MEAAVDAVERGVLEWVHPGLRWYDSPTDGWALVRLYDTVLLLGAWGVFVAGVIVYQLNQFALERAERERRIGSTEGGGYRLGGSTAPIKAPAQGAATHHGAIVQALFSATQVALGSFAMAQAWSKSEALSVLPVCNGFKDGGRGDIPALVHTYFVSQVFELAEVLVLMLRGESDRVTPTYAAIRASGFMLIWLHVRIGYDGDVCAVIMVCAAIRVLGHLLQLLAVCAFGSVAPGWMQLCASVLQMLPLGASVAYAGLVFSDGCDMNAQPTGGAVGLPKRLVILWVAWAGCKVLSSSTGVSAGRLKVE